jgi:acetyl esterase/lipase
MHSETIKLYKNREDVTLTTYLQDDSFGAEPRPAVLICPGGAYLFCSPREAEPVALAFFKYGFQAFVLRYSVYDNGTGEGEKARGTKLPHNLRSVYPAPLRDLGKAMLCVREHAGDWCVDTGKIAICGFSAGGHNCAMYSVYWNKPMLANYFKVEAKNLRPAASILCYAMTDYVTLKEAIPDQDADSRGMWQASDIAYFGDYKMNKDSYVQMSPARLVDKNTPPTFLWATSEDALVPVRQSIIMAGALANKNIPFELHIFEKGPHGLSLATEETATKPEEINADAARWFPLCIKWLSKRFGLKQ